MKTEQEINQMLEAIYSLQDSGDIIDEHMQGYVKALEWVLEKLQVIKNDTNKSK
jgi:hypothetical protein